MSNIPNNQRHNRAFDARLAYEKNCIAKYDSPVGAPQRPSRPPKKGDKMSDYAMRYGTSEKEMKDYYLMGLVDRELKRLKLEV